MFGTEKLEWWGYITVKNVEDIFSDVDRLPACDGWTDGRADGQTFCNGIVLAMHTCHAVKCVQWVLCVFEYFYCDMHFGFQWHRFVQYCVPCCSAVILLFICQHLW